MALSSPVAAGEMVIAGAATAAAAVEVEAVVVAVEVLRAGSRGWYCGGGLLPAKASLPVPALWVGGVETAGTAARLETAASLTEAAPATAVVVAAAVEAVVGAGGAGELAADDFFEPGVFVCKVRPPAAAVALAPVGVGGPECD
jgi:hypothetical protein